jgi:preprotein translocase subunit SecG
MVIHFFCAAAIVSLVLLQRGKGADAGAGFGAGASGTVFGARGASTALSRATAILAGIFMITSLSLAYVGTRKTISPAGNGILDQFATPAAPANSSAPVTSAPVTSPSVTTAPMTEGVPAGAPASNAPVAPAPPANAPASGAPAPK